MKTSAKVLLIIGLLLMVAGGVVMAASWGLVGGDWYKFSITSSDVREETVSVNENFTNISINSDSRNVILMPSEDGKCSVTAPQGSSIHTRIEVETNALKNEGTLCIDVNNNSKWYEHFVVSTVALEGSKIIVRLPEREYRSLTVMNGSGSTNIPKDFSFEKAEISNASGSISFYASVSDTLTLTSASGSVRAGGMECEDLTVSAVSGSIQLENIKCRSLEIETVSGSTELVNAVSDEISAEAVSGSITLENVKTDSLEVETVSGSVTIPQNLKSVTEFESVSGSLKYR